MCKNIDRHPTAIHIIRSGGRAATLVDCLLALIDNIADRLPYKPWIILVGGGNDLCGSDPSPNARDLAIKVIMQFKRLESFCIGKGYRLTISHVIPRPLEQGEKTPNPAEVRQKLADAYRLINMWIGDRDKERNETPLVLSRFLEFNREDTTQSTMKRRRIRERTYDATGQQKIRTNRFAQDGVHLAGQGIIAVESAIVGLIEAAYD